jgi:hypothetical protein
MTRRREVYCWVYVVTLTLYIYIYIYIYIYKPYIYIFLVFLFLVFKKNEKWYFLHNSDIFLFLITKECKN